MYNSAREEIYILLLGGAAPLFLCLPNICPPPPSPPLSPVPRPIPRGMNVWPDGYHARARRRGANFSTPPRDQTGAEATEEPPDRLSVKNHTGKISIGLATRFRL